MPTDNSSGFDMLLARLDPDREEASRKYHELRRKLIKFHPRGCPFPQDCVDEAFDRTARKLFEGEDIENLKGFVLGVARLVHQEMVNRKIRVRKAVEIRVRKAVEELRRALVLGGDPAKEEKHLRWKGYDRCLSDLPPDDRNLFLRYYYQGRVQREELCLQLDISIGVPSSNPISFTNHVCSMV